jgi:transcriptional regulator with XRE-family HTH domain
VNSHVLKKLMRDKKLSQENFANRVGISRCTLMNFLYKDIISEKTRHKILVALCESDFTQAEIDLVKYEF